MRLRRQGPAQSRQGVSRRCIAAPSSAACTCTPGSCRSRTCRDSDRAADGRDRSSRETQRTSRTPCNGRSASGDAARSRRPGHASARIGRPVQTRPDARPRRPRRRHRSTSRRSWCSPPGRHAARRDRGAARRPRARCSPSSRWTTARCSAAPTGRGTLGGVLAANLVGPAAHRGGRGARSFPRLRGGVRSRRGVQGRRPRGEERHRLRPLQADGRLVGHAGGADRGHRQGAAARPRARRPLAVRGPRRRARRRGDERAPWARRATSPARPICRPGRRRNACSAMRRRRRARSRRCGSKAWPPRSRIARSACSTAAMRPYGELVIRCRRFARASGARPRRRRRSRRAETTGGRCGASRRRPCAGAELGRSDRRRGGCAAALRLGRRSGLGRGRARGGCRRRRACATAVDGCGGHATLIRAPAARARHASTCSSRRRRRSPP